MMPMRSMTALLDRGAYSTLLTEHVVHEFLHCPHPPSVERCSQTSAQSQKMIQTVMHDFQERFQRCAYRCQDIAKVGVSLMLPGRRLGWEDGWEED